jgi:hypothetical protein
MELGVMQLIILITHLKYGKMLQREDYYNTLIKI